MSGAAASPGDETEDNVQKVDLGVDPCGKNMLPPLLFDDLWYALDVPKRSILLEMMRRKSSVSGLSLETSLGLLKYNEAFTLVELLMNCSVAQFGPYIQVCSVDRGGSVHDQHSSQTKWQRTMNSQPQQNSEKNPDRKSSQESMNNELGLSDTSLETGNRKSMPLSETAIEPTDPRLIQMIHNLPAELLLQIQERFLDSVFRPRLICPYDQLPNNRVFKALNKELLAKYKRIYFSDNTWLIGQGDYDAAVRFLFCMPDSIRQMIKKVEMAFTTQDCPHHSLNAYLALPIPSDPRDARNALEMCRSYRTECARVTRQLMKIWYEKFVVVASLDLESFALDFRDAYAPDGEYLGVRIARFLVPFRLQPPTLFSVRAPTEALRERIWRVIMVGQS